MRAGGQPPGNQVKQKQMTQLRQLHAEFSNLKSELFGNSLFVVLDDQSEKTIRYNQLLGFFFPCYRTAGWINPAISTETVEICDSQTVEEYEMYYV